VPQGSVSGPIFSVYIIYVNEVDFSTCGKISIFAGDRKLFSVISTVEKIRLLRDDLQNMCAWLMLFNVELECGSMPNVMVALPNISGALCSTPQSFADAHYLTAVQ